jgi:hypothetical protein
MENNSDKKQNIQKASGLLVGGCLFLGMAAGWYFGKMLIGMFAGLGIGLILHGVIVLSNANKN